jgi:hypothetical protein
VGLQRDPVDPAGSRNGGGFVGAIWCGCRVCLEALTTFYDPYSQAASNIYQYIAETRLALATRDLAPSTWFLACLQAHPGCLGVLRRQPQLVLPDLPLLHAGGRRWRGHDVFSKVFPRAATSVGHAEALA